MRCDTTLPVTYKKVRPPTFGESGLAGLTSQTTANAMGAQVRRQPPVMLGGSLRRSVLYYIKFSPCGAAVKWFTSL